MAATVLIVDDNADVAHISAKVLSSSALRTNFLNPGLSHGFNVVEIRHFTITYQGYCCAAFACTCGSSDTVEVVWSILRNTIINNVSNALNI